MTYSGKQFEQDFFKDAKEFTFEALVTRLYDTTNGFKGVANPCDFIVASKYSTIFVELKTTTDTALPFSNISDNQWASLLRAEMCEHSHGGILVYFERHGELIWYPLCHLQRLKSLGAKSVNPEKHPYLGFAVEHSKKRVRLDIPFRNFLDAVRRQHEEEQNGEAQTS